jgi:Na+/H+ antiporter NhaD/arsenite permease-like protein
MASWWEGTTGTLLCGLASKGGSSEIVTAICANQTLWNVLFSLLTFLTTGMVVFIVAFPIRWRIPRTRYFLVVDLAIAPPLGVLFLYCAGAFSLAQGAIALVGRGGVEPLSILVLFYSLSYISVSIDVSGLFAFLSWKMVARAKGTTWKLWMVIFGSASLLTVFTSNDIVILTLTPIACYITKYAKCDPRPFLFAQFLTANVCSSLFVIGNLTNIVVASVYNLTFLEYFLWMALPTLTALVLLITMLLFLFWGDLQGSCDDFIIPTLPMRSRTAAIIGCIILGCCLSAFVLLSLIHVPLWVVALPFALAALLKDIILDLTGFVVSQRQHSHPEKDKETPHSRSVDVLPSNGGDGGGVSLASTDGANLGGPIGAERVNVPLEEVQTAEGIYAPFPSEDSGMDASFSAAVEEKEEDEDGQESLAMTQVPLELPPHIPQVASFSDLAQELQSAQASPDATSTHAQTPELQSAAPENSPHFGPLTETLAIDMDSFPSIELAPSTPISMVAVQPHLQVTAVALEAPPQLELPEIMPTFEAVVTDPHTTVTSAVTLDNGGNSSEEMTTIEVTDGWQSRIQRLFPLTSRALARQPLKLIPFLLSMILLVEVLEIHGWMQICAGGLARVVGDNIFAAVFATGLLAIVLANAMNNIPMTIFMVRVLQNEAFAVSYSLRLACMFALVLSSNLGVGFLLMGSLAGLMWSALVNVNGIAMRGIHFLRHGLLIMPLVCGGSLGVLWLQAGLLSTMGISGGALDPEVSLPLERHVNL